MRLALIAFAAGVWLLQTQARLPAGESLAWLTAAMLACAFGAWAVRTRVSWAAVWLAAAATFCAGFGYAALRAEWRLADEIAAELEGRDVEVLGVVAGLPQSFERGLRFDFEVEQARAGVPRLMQLAWYRGWRDEEFHRFREVHAGERWRLTVRLKRPHGNMNPGGFDYEGWLFERGIRATGYVRSAQPNARLDEFVARPALVVARLRESIRTRFLDMLPEGEHAGVLVALAVGDQRAIDPARWEIFNRTGTTHLMSISGLHVTMVAGLAAWLASALWRRVPAAALRLPAAQAGVAAGWLAAFGYSLLAGFAVPAQRTLYMLSVVAIALWLRRTTAPSRLLLLALVLVLLLDPWAVTSAGFWLSFGAVAVLFQAGSGRIRPEHWLARWGRAQWAVTLGMIPALLALFHSFSLVSPLANAVAIPVVSLVVTPLTLLAAAVPWSPPLELAHWITGHLMRLLEAMAGWSWAMWQQPAPPAWAVAAGIAGVVWLLLPRGFPARWVGIVLLLPLVAAAPPRPEPGALRLTVLDVGQGLAVHAQTTSHDLLYDTGPRYAADADAGSRVILPYLRALGVARLDGLVVSHLDNDHAGGAQAVVEGLPVGWLSSSLPDDHPLRAAAPEQRRCAAGQRWDWDGVAFEVLHPQRADYEGALRAGNDMSCVLRIQPPRGAAVLLAGDIEAGGEERLATAGVKLRAEILLAPHHGSRGSSSAVFVEAVAPSTVVYSTAYRSRFRHPHPEVEERYARAGAQALRTDRDGALDFRIGPAGVEVVRERERAARYWHGR
jgi:competence protein ComEC